MTKDDLWNGLIERYPSFKDDEFIVKQRARGLRRLIQQAWDEGHKAGVENGRALEAARLSREKPKNPFSELFG